jgi:hypothetical protein
MDVMADSFGTDCNCRTLGFGETFLGMPLFNGISAETIIGELTLCQ